MHPDSPRDEKIEAYIEHNDHDAEHHLPTSKDDNITDAYNKGQIATGYETISIPQTIMKFKMACLVCFLATFAAATDGYQSESSFSMPHSLACGAYGTARGLRLIFSRYQREYHCESR
jgi:hypothetical protein